MNKGLRKITAYAPLLPLTISYATGIIAGTYIQSIWMLAIMTILAAIATILKRYQAAAWIVAFGLGAINMSTNIPDSAYLDQITDSPRTYRADILSVANNDNSQSAIIELNEAGVSSANLRPIRRIRAQITIPTFEFDLKIGDIIVFKGQCMPLKSRTDLPDENDMDRYLHKKFIEIRAFIPPEDILEAHPSGGIKSKATQIREQLKELLYRSQLSSGTKEFLNTTLLGDSSDLSAETRSAFTASGLSNILALSGLHVGLIAIFISIALWPVSIATGDKRPAMIMTIIILWGYAIITGLSPSVTRAVIMTTIYLTGRILQRRTFALNSLMAAALLILIFAPEDLFKIGFQLSFTAVLSIILFGERINPIGRNHPLAYPIANYIAISISAMLGTALISAYYFHTMPVLFILSNMLTAILLPFIIAGGLIVLLLSATGISLVFICNMTNGLYNILSSTANIIAEIPGATITGIYFPAWIIAIYAVWLITFHLFLKHNNLKTGLLTTSVAICVIASMALQPKINRSPRLYLARETYRTDLIIDNGTDTLNIFSTLTTEPITVATSSQRKYSDYMGKRGIKQMNILPKQKTAGQLFQSEDNYIQFGSQTIALAGRDIPERTRKCNYIIVCRGYMGNIEELTDRFQPDTIILSHDLHIRRSQNYRKECTELEIPVIDMREQGWSVGAH